MAVELDVDVSQGVLPTDRGGRPKVSVSINPGTTSDADDSERHVVLCIDVSGSMDDADKIGCVKQGIEDIFAAFDPKDQVSIVTFESDVESPLAMTQWDEVDATEAADLIEELELGSTTDLYGGLEEALEQLQAASMSADRVARRILLLSDGKHNVGSRDREEFERLARDIKAAGGSIMAAGIGTLYDRVLMKALADASQGDWEHIEAPEEIGTFFDREVGRAAGLVAPMPELVVDFAPGFQPHEVYRRVPQAQSVDVNVTNGRLVVPVGDLHAGERQLVTFELLAPPKDDAVEYTAVECALESGSATLDTAELVLEYREEAPPAETSGPPGALRDHVRGRIMDRLTAAESPTELDDVETEIDELEAEEPSLPSEVFDELRQRLEEARRGDWQPITTASRDL
jgi:Ca-activated chloride channel family protein